MGPRATDRRAITLSASRKDRRRTTPIHEARAELEAQNSPQPARRPARRDCLDARGNPDQRGRPIGRSLPDSVAGDSSGTPRSRMRPDGPRARIQRPGATRQCTNAPHTKPRGGPHIRRKCNGSPDRNAWTETASTTAEARLTPEAPDVGHLARQRSTGSEGPPCRRPEIEGRFVELRPIT